MTPVTHSPSLSARLDTGEVKLCQCLLSLGELLSMELLAVVILFPLYFLPWGYPFKKKKKQRKAQLDVLLF